MPPAPQSAGGMDQGVDTTMCRFRGKEMSIDDARATLTKSELEEVEVTQQDGSVIRPFRFGEVDPVVTSNDDEVFV